MPPASSSNFEPLSTMDVNAKKEILKIIDDLEKHLREVINRIRMMLIKAPTLAPPPSPSALAPLPPPHTLTPSPSPPTLATAQILSTVAPVPSPSTLTSSPSPPTLAFTSSPSTLAPATLPPTLAPGTFPPTFAPAASSSTLTPASFLSTPAPAPSPPNPALTLYSPTLAPVQSLPTSAPGLSSSTLASTPSPSTLAPTPSPPILAPTQSLPTLAPVPPPPPSTPSAPEQPSSLSPPAFPVPVPAQPKLEVTHEALFSVIYSSRDFFLYTASFAQVEEFYVQLDSRYKAELKVPPRAEMLRATNVAVKQLVCVRNKAEDCFFRSQILKANDDGSFFVRNIDFGDRLKVQPDDIFTLHEEFCSQPAMAVHCYIDGKWDQCNAMFDTLILSFDKFPEPTDFFDAARVTIYPSLVDGSKYPVSVEVKTRAGQNWKELFEVPLDKTCVTVPQTIKSKFFCFKDFLTSARLTEENFDERSPEGYQQLTQFFGNAVHLLKLGEPTSSVSKLRCIYVACVSRFVLVAEGAADLVTNMSLFYWGNLERPFAGTVNPGSLVVFALKRFFFRGLVMKSSSANIEVYAIDLGFTVSVPVSALRPLFSPLFSLERLPPKALIAGLERITSPYGSGKWQSIAVETLKSIARGREVVVVPSRFQGGTYAVDLTACSEGQGQEQNAIALLKKFKLAKDADQ